MERIKEGDLYKLLNIDGTDFEIRYGYYSEAERDLWEPTPIFPDFISSPMYTCDGKPYATAEQDVCKYFKVTEDASEEGWCADCIYFRMVEEIIGVCECEYLKNN